MIARLPFTNDPAQVITVTLDTGTFDFYLRWNERAQQWCMSIGDNPSQKTLVSNVPILLGQSLLQPYDLGIGFFFAYAEDGISRDAAFDDLGSRINVYYASVDEIASLVELVGEATLVTVIETGVGYSNAIHDGVTTL